MLAKTLTKYLTWFNGLSEGERAIFEFILDIMSIGTIGWLLYHLNSPWWGYLLTLFCVIIQKAITDK
jgi:hypothetical protein